MKFEVKTDYLGPVELGEYEHVTVKLPDGRSVSVYADMIYIATEADVAGHRDGQKIWDKGSPERSPYGLVRPLKEEHG